MFFEQMENIAAYTGATRRFGVPEPDMFVTVDLFEGKNIAAVVRNLHSLGRVAQQRGFVGPTLGAQLASANVRLFTQASSYPASVNDTSHPLSSFGSRIHTPQAVGESPPPFNLWMLLVRHIPN